MIIVDTLAEMIFYLQFNMLIMKYVFNHYYYLRHDKFRTLMYNKISKHNNPDYSTDWLQKIHPIYAMLFSFFSSPIELSDAVDKVTKFLCIEKKQAEKIISIFLENKEEFHTRYSNSVNNFPKNVIIREELLENPIKKYYPEMFAYSSVDVSSVRLYESPIHITFMLTNKCITNCIYCYADRNMRYKALSFDVVERFIKDAYDSQIRWINVDGGDFFLYPHWKKLLKTLEKYNYIPELVSTKFPISKNDFDFFATFSIPLQISIDSFDQNVLDMMVGKIENYSEKLKRTLSMINEERSFQVATILTKFNGYIENLEDMYSYLSTLENMRRWEIRVAFKSLYSKNDFEDFQISTDSIKKIETWIVNKRKTSSIDIVWSPSKQDAFFKSSKGSKDFEGARCSANSTHMFVLPDGNVTICEQLYWDNRFIIGNIINSKISDIWNSDRAKYLANIPQNDISIDSACRNCSIFSECYKSMNRCFANIMKIYGKDNIDYPDPRCNKAPRDISKKIYV